MKKSLFNYVHEILSQKELIIVPNFGAFVLQKTTTFLNDGDYISIIFSAQQQNDDEVLSTYIAKENNYSKQDADEFIESSLEDIYSIIDEKGIFSIEGIGEFRAINDRIVFKPFDEQFLLSKETKTETIKEPVKEPLIEIQKPIVETTAFPTSSEKVDIEAIKQTYAERNAAPQSNEEKPKVEERKEEKLVENKSPEPIKTKEASTFNVASLKLPIIIITVVAILGVLAYIFRNEISTLNKPAQTNDTTQVVIEQGIDQLADTLQEIQNIQQNEITESATTAANEENLQNTNTSDTSLTKPSKQYTANKVRYGNNSITMYYVTKASFGNRAKAEVEKNNLDYTGFNASIIETDGSNNYHVVIAEFSDLELAKQELAFSKQIDKSFYLMTVKPRK